MNESLEYKNPILSCDFSDPDVIRVGSDYYMVSSSFTYIPGVPVLHSVDLVHWERIGYCVKEIPFERYNKPAHGCGTWAPSIRYRNGLFYVFIPMPDEGIFVTTSKDPSGEWTPLKCIKSASGWIDPCPLWDDDGQVYMAHAFAKSRCGIKHKIQVSKLNIETLDVEEDGPIVFDGTLTQPTAEGPKMYKRNGWYYIFIPAGGVATGWQCVLRSKNIYGPYEEKIVLHQGNTDINGPHQGAWVDTPDGQDAFLHFQDVGNCGRIVHLQPMCWKLDWPFIGTEQNGDGIGEPVITWKYFLTPDMSRQLNFSDDFEKGVPGLQWQWQANPKESWIEHSSNNELRMVAQKYENDIDNTLWRLPNVLSQMLPANSFQMEITVDLNDALCDLGAGISILGMEYSFLQLVKKSQKYFLQVGTGKVFSKEATAQAQEKIINEFPVDTSKVTIHTEVHNAKTVSYRIQADNHTFDGLEFPIDKAVWTGARIGIFSRCINETSKSDKKSYAIFKNVGIKLHAI